VEQKENYDRILVFGEVLFDIFPDQSRVIGGAPFNVARHLRGMSLDPFFVSRVGNDDAGQEVRLQMQEWGMDTGGLQVDPEKPTGRVLVKFHDNEPSYEIKEDAAFDRIEAVDSLEALQVGRTLFYHGTLAARSPRSSRTLYSLAKKSLQTVFCDINLRDPWWSPELIRDILTWCNYLKVNLEELDRVAGILGFREEGVENMGRAVQERCRLQGLVLTMGSRGAMFFPSEGRPLFAAAPEVHGFKDSVGAGDSFSAVFMLGLCRNWSWERIMHSAVQTAARLCTIQGAVPDDRGFYSRLVDY